MTCRGAGLNVVVVAVHWVADCRVTTVGVAYCCVTTVGVAYCRVTTVDVA